MIDSPRTAAAQAFHGAAAGFAFEAEGLLPFGAAALPLAAFLALAAAACNAARDTLRAA